LSAGGGATIQQPRTADESIAPAAEHSDAAVAIRRGCGTALRGVSAIGASRQ